MRLFCVVSDAPAMSDAEPGITAVHIILGELLANLKKRGHQIILQPVFSVAHGQTLSLSEKTRFEKIKQTGMECLEPLFSPRPIKKIFGGGIEEFYPSILLRDSVRKRVELQKPDRIVTFWSPEGVAATHGLQIKRVAYHGDVDPLVRRTYFENFELFNADVRISMFTRFNQHREVVRLEKAHHEIMNAVNVIANVTASNAAYYTTRGHKRSVYLSNTWKEPLAMAPPALPTTGPIKIIGHFGQLNRSGSTYGLRYLTENLMPALEREMLGLNYEVHVMGGGEPVAALKPKLAHRRLQMRGFVPNLENELRSSQAVLLLNNAGPFQAAFTRHFVVWSLGLCLVAHVNSRLAIPELKHLENCLLASDPNEMARLIRLAVTDQQLNLRLSRNGFETYRQQFAPQIVAARLDELLK